ncbi:MAG: hypothetical protein V2I37_12485 [Marinilabiliaceae bacterium]|nr:hypothetical protein [Marinilabiliaceae bacterium]
MSRINSLYASLKILLSMVRYNLKIIFANKFIWFLLGAFGFYIGLILIYVFSEDISRMEDLYGIFIFCGILLVFYPTVFGIQNDQDARTIEILFGIPNYRYKVWLVRIVLIYLITFVILMGFVSLTSYLVIRMPVISVTYQVLYPVFFLGVMSFMMSTLVRNGNGAAVIMIIFSLFFLILADELDESKWNVFLNPFNIPNNVSETSWSRIVIENRIILMVGIILFLLAGLFRLQKREKFI